MNKFFLKLFAAFLVSVIFLSLAANSYAQQDWQDGRSGSTNVAPSTLGFAPQGQQAGAPLDIIRQQRQQQQMQQQMMLQEQQAQQQQMMGGQLTPDQIFALNNPHLMGGQQMMGQEMLDPYGFPLIQQENNPRRVLRNNRMLINGIQGHDLPQKTWEPRELNIRERMGQRNR